MKRKGLGLGRGMGYKNLIPTDRPIHQMSAKGFKQPQRMTYLGKCGGKASPMDSIEKWRKEVTDEVDARLKKDSWVGGGGSLRRDNPVDEQILKFRKVSQNKGLFSDIFEEYMIRRFPTSKRHSMSGKDAKFGSVSWQNEMLANIDKKIAKGEKLDDYELAFIQIQAEHSLRKNRSGKSPKLGGLGDKRIVGWMGYKAKVRPAKMEHNVHKDDKKNLDWDMFREMKEKQEVGGLGDKKQSISNLSDDALEKLWFKHFRDLEDIPYNPSAITNEIEKRHYLRVKKGEKIVGGLGDNRPDSDFDPKELKMGMKVEMEHTKDPKVAKEIVKDHLTEFPKGYYEELDRMEKKLKKENKPKYTVTSAGMKKGYWRIVDNKGVTVNNGISSKKAAEEIAKMKEDSQ